MYRCDDRVICSDGNNGIFYKYGYFITRLNLTLMKMNKEIIIDRAFRVVLNIIKMYVVFQILMGVYYKFMV